MAEIQTGTTGMEVFVILTEILPQYKADLNDEARQAKRLRLKL